MRPLQYILNGHELVPEPDFMRWSELFEHADRTNTVFLGLDHNFF
jgi:hypothetical protein